MKRKGPRNSPAPVGSLINALSSIIAYFTMLEWSLTIVDGFISSAPDRDSPQDL